MKQRSRVLRDRLVLRGDRVAEQWQRFRAATGVRWIGALGCLGGGLLVARAAGSAGDSSALFMPSSRCLACHNGLVSKSGEDVSIGNHWRSSAMANAARDPYWQGALRREFSDHPESVSKIEDECTRCHMPMTTFTANLRQQPGQAFRHLVPPRQQSTEDALALDGVSCSVCHQITSARLGEPSSFTGGFAIDTRIPRGKRKEFGPFPVDAQRASVMQSSARFVPERANHLRDSALCASCHTLYTEPLGPGGQGLGRFPEQVPYHEWLHGDYAQRQPRSCQSCHMPSVDDGTPFTSVLPHAQWGWRRHSFRGSNFLLERMLAVHGDMQMAALEPLGFELGIQQTLEFLRQRSARLTLGPPTLANGRLQADVVVTNTSGHKLPTAYPARRAWIHFTVRDRAGKVIFESGKFLPSGAIAGNDNDRDADRFEPHYLIVERPDQVQIYESIMGDAQGRVTTGLLLATQYLKDNRLLPQGFEKRTAVPDIAVQGDAVRDPDFVGGEDRMRYAVTIDPSRAPFRVQAELWFQPVGYRWAENLAPYRAMEPRRFLDWYRSLSAGSATLLARAERP